MGFKPRFKITNTTLNNLTQVSASKSFIEKAPIIPVWEAKLRKQAIVRSAHFSTAIEGNKLTLEEVESILEGKEVEYVRLRDRQEVLNYKKIIVFISTNPEVTVETINRINKISLEKIDEKNGGELRKIQNYVVKQNEDGTKQIIYTPPKPDEVPRLIKELVEWVHEEIGKKTSSVLVAGVAHHQLVTIHPYVDGNGRTARALATLILYNSGYDIKKLFSLEEYYDQDLAHYYDSIQKAMDMKDLTEWLEYFTEGIATELTRIEKEILELTKKQKVAVEPEKLRIELNRRQLKALNHIRKEGKITNREYRKKFGVSNYTAYKDLEELHKRRLVKKVGKGRTTYYTTE